MSPQSQPLAVLMSWGEERSRVLLTLTEDGEITIGRDGSNTVALPADKMISRHHCALRADEGRITVRDLDSGNGTYLNGQRLHGEAVVTPPAWLSVGMTRFVVLPPVFSAEDETLVRQSVYSTEGNVLVPPSDVFEEHTQALMVADLVKSSDLLGRGESFLIKVITALGETLERALRDEREAFLQSTGDGYLACFDTAEGALAAARELGPALRQHFPVPIQVSVALHWGTSRATPRGNRSGKNVHATFSLERLRHRSRRVSRLLAGKKSPQVTLMTDAFVRQLDPASRNQTVAIGLFALDGLSERVEVLRLTDAPGPEIR